MINYSLEELYVEAEAMVSAFALPYKKLNIDDYLKNLIHIVDLGVLIVCITPNDYTIVLQKLESKFPNYRYIFLATTDDFITKKEEVFIDLVKSGYMKFLRLTYPNQFIININNYNLDKKVIKARLKIWNNKPKFKYLIEENKIALEFNTRQLLSIDPSFLDYIPEE